MQECNCVGHEFLRYAQEILSEDKPESAIYLGCIAEHELLKLGEYDAGIYAIDFNMAARKMLKIKLERNLELNKIPNTKENLTNQVRIFSEGIKEGLRRVIYEQGYVNLSAKQIPETLVERTRDVIMGMVA